MSTMKCFLDMDGVLTDFVRAMCERHRVVNPYDDPKNYGNYNMAELLGMNHGEFWFPAEHHQFWAAMNWMPDGREILEFVEETFGEENVCLFTDPSQSGTSASGKMNWVNRLIPRYNGRLLIGKPKAFCAHAGVVLIDDRDENVDQFNEAGGQAILVPRPWNRLHDLSKYTKYPAVSWINVALAHSQCLGVKEHTDGQET